MPFPPAQHQDYRQTKVYQQKINRRPCASEHSQSQLLQITTDVLQNTTRGCKYKIFVNSEHNIGICFHFQSHRRGLFVKVTEMENFTRHGNVSNNQASTASQSIFVFLSALNIFLSITASLGNALILIALDKVTSVHSPTLLKLFFRCLAVTDLCAGLIVQPSYVVTVLGLYTPTIITINSSITHY